jgi:hypothetical protein
LTQSWGTHRAEDAASAGIIGSESVFGLQRPTTSMITLKSLIPVALALGGLTCQAATGSEYEGHFESECENVADGLYTRDVMDVSAPKGKAIPVRYTKAMYAAEGCAAADLMGLLELPPGTWRIDGQAKLGDKVVHRISINLPAGQLKVTQAHPDHVREQDDRWVIITRKGEPVPIEKEVAPSIDADLRSLSGDLLYVGDMEAPKDGIYPTALNMNSPLTRLRVPSYVSLPKKAP